MKRITLLIPILLLFLSCKDISAEPVGNYYYFENSQPIDDSELTKIPNKFQGLFMDSDSVFLHVKENVIFSELFYKFKIHKNDIDSLRLYFDYLNGTYISKDDHEIFQTNKVGDSIELFKKYTDTLFAFSNSQKAKKISNHLILNTKDSIYWRIKILSIQKNRLKLQHIYSDEDLKKLDSITRNKSEMIDSTSYIIRPTRKEFKNILNLKELGDERQFKKVGK